MNGKAMKCRYLYASVWNSGDYPTEDNDPDV